MAKTSKEHDNNMSYNESNSKSSELLHQKKWDIASTLDDNNLTLEDIKRSIKIDDEWDIMKMTKFFINRIWFNSEFYNSRFINAVTRCQISNSEHLHWDCVIIGFRKADAILKDNPHEKIVAYSYLPTDAGMYSTLLQIPDLFIIKRCLENPNFILVNCRKDWDCSNVRFWQGYNQEFYEWISKYIQSRKYEYIWIIRCKLDIYRNRSYNIQDLLENKKLVLESLYKDYNSIYWPCTFDEFIEIITDDEWYKNWVDIMKWRKLVWIYCDIDWTLIVEGKDGLIVNEKVLNYLEEQEKLWKEIHLWTWWEIYEQKRKLRKFWIKYPLTSKYKHQWAKAETVIDDLDYNSFVSDYWIKVQNYINVDDL